MKWSWKIAFCERFPRNSQFALHNSYFQYFIIIIFYLLNASLVGSMHISFTSFGGLLEYYKVSSAAACSHAIEFSSLEKLIVKSEKKSFSILFDARKYCREISNRRKKLKIQSKKVSSTENF